ncbi:MAG: RidA family protein [Alphaproteobacteria bacterium]|nr:RidA family protein [Alphaproteobacteria bacterium]
MDAPRPIAVPGVPPPGGHYSPAIVHGGLVYVSGQLGARPDGASAADQPFEDQARQALANLLAVLAAAGASPDRLLKVTAYIVGVDNWPAFNAVYAEVMGEARPARSVVPVPELHHGYLVEIDAIAARAQTEDD